MFNYSEQILIDYQKQIKWQLLKWTLQRYLVY